MHSSLACRHVDGRSGSSGTCYPVGVTNPWFGRFVYDVFDDGEIVQWADHAQRVVQLVISDNPAGGIFVKHPQSGARLLGSAVATDWSRIQIMDDNRHIVLDEPLPAPLAKESRYVWHMPRAQARPL